MDKILPNFSTIKFLSPGSTAKNEEQPTLFKFFHASLHQKPMEVDEQLLQQFIQNDLGIDLVNMDKRLVGVLQDMIVYYMTVWPGWGREEEYYKGKLDINSWFERFRQYLILKTNFVIKQTEKSESEKKPDVESIAVQTNKPDANEVCTYAVCISGPPSMLNSLSFRTEDGGIVGQAFEERPMGNLTLVEFLNWPFVSVEVKLPNLWFTRTMSHKYERCLAHQTGIPVQPKESSIKFIKRTEDAKDKVLIPYTDKFIAASMKTLITILREISLIQLNRLTELTAICGQFLKDIQEAKVYNCTMCSGISVGYHIGQCTYIRKKKTMHGEKEDPIKFYEIITPQVDFTLNQFEESQVFLPNGAPMFSSLQKLFSGGTHMNDLVFFVNNTCIVYNCTFCSENFSGPHAFLGMLKHLQGVHKGEQAVKCYKCLQEFEFGQLSKQRWSHNCPKNCGQNATSVFK